MSEFSNGVTADWKRDSAAMFEVLGEHAKTRRELMVEARERVSINAHYRSSIKLWISLLSEVDHPTTKRVVREMGNVLEKTKEVKNG